MSKINFNCEECEKSFKAYKEHRSGKNIFCSVICASNFRKGSTPWNKELTKETDKRIKSSWNKGLKGLRWQNVEAMIEYNKRNGIWNKGKKLPQISGKNHWNYGNKMSNYQREKLFIGNKKYMEEKGPWSRGLTKYTDKRVKMIGEKNSIRLKDYIKNNPEEIERLKEMRKNIKLPVKDSSIEIKIQNFLKQLGIEFFTHQYMKEIEHGYQCDILIPSMNLVIECDGDYWHKYPIGLERDHIRTKELIEQGFKVLRIWESEIKIMNIDDFKNKIRW